MADTRARETTQAIRAELAAIDPHRSCCRAAERAGLGPVAQGQARSPVVARLVVRLAGDATDGSGPAASPFDWAGAREHCRASWMRGRFLAVGSLSLGARGAHLEFVVAPEEGRLLHQRLAQVGFPTATRARRGRAVVTSKRTETILGLLRFCGAGASVLEVESRLVMRQLHGHLNRVLNAETANLERTVASSARQIVFIERLESDGRLAEMSPVDQAVAQARRSAPEASFSELAAALGLSRARVQRSFSRLESAAAASPALPTKMGACDPSSSRPTGR